MNRLIGHSVYEKRFSSTQDIIKTVKLYLRKTKYFVRYPCTTTLCNTFLFIPCIEKGILFILLEKLIYLKLNTLKVEF